MLALFRVPGAYRIQFSEGSHFDFNGYLKSVGQEVSRKEIVTIKVTFKCSGKPLYTPAT